MNPKDLENLETGGRNNPQAPETDIVCQYCGNALFRLHGVQHRNRMLVVCTQCKAPVATIIDWTFTDARKEHPRDEAE